MLTEDQQNQGTQFTGFLRTNIRTADMDSDANSLAEGQNQQTFFSGREDFLKTNPSQSAPWNTDYSAAGSPTYDYVANGVGGQVQITLAADDEGTLVGSGWDDNLQIDGLRYFCVGARFMLPALLETNQYLLVGVAGAVKSGVNPVTLAGLKFVGLYIGADDIAHARSIGSVTQTNYATGITPAADTWYWVIVENDQAGNLHVYFGAGLGEDGSDLLAYSGPIANTFAAGTKFQPISGVGKFSGSTTPSHINDALVYCGHRAPA